MSERKRQVKLGVSMQGHGYHHSAWLHPDVPPDGPARLDHYQNVVRIAERGLFDMAFLADFVTFPMTDVPKGSLDRSARVGFEPVTLLSALAPTTQNIGLVATASTTFGVPFHVARQYASLDLLSGGRAGWNVVTSFQDEEAVNFGSNEILQKAERYARAQEFVEVVTGLWNSFEPDTFLYDKATGRFFDPEKVNVLNHKGEHFSVQGPLNVPPSQQGRPIIVQAGSSEPGQELAARTADVVYTVQNTMSDAQAFYAGLKKRMAKYGRAPDHLKIMPGIVAVTADTEAEAKERFAEMQKLVDPMEGLRYLARVFGDLSGYDLDGPVPDLRTDKELQSRAKVLLNIARRDNLSIRQMFQRASIGNAHVTVVGTPGQVADIIAEWIASDAADGFNVLPAFSPVSLGEFVDRVVPELQDRGIYRTEYEASTLRGNLGLPAPAPLPAAQPEAAA